MDQITLALAKNYTDEQIRKSSTGEMLIDKTLSKEGYAADAKVVGDKIKIVEDNIETNINKALTEAKESGEFDGPQGETGPSAIYVGAEAPENEDITVWINPEDDDFSDFISTPPTAEVGQTIVVKAVDESGKPTEWEAVDLPSGGASQNRLLAELTITESVSNITFEFPEVTNKVLVEFDSQECSEFSGKTAYIAFGDMEGIYPQPFNSAKNGNVYYALAEVFAPGVIKMTTWGGDSRYGGYDTYSTLLWDVGEVSSFRISQYGDSPADLNGAVLRAYGG